jgi:hypothetical protein
MVFAFEMSKHAKNSLVCQSERPRLIYKNQSDKFTNGGNHCEYFTQVPFYNSGATTPQNWASSYRPSNPLSGHCAAVCVMSVIEQLVFQQRTQRINAEIG